MTPSTAAIYQTRTCTPESLRTLASFLELALDEGKSVVVMRIGSQVRSVYVGNPSGALEELTDSGVVDAFQADEMLVLTRLGLNRITADGPQQRREVLGCGAVLRSHQYDLDQRHEMRRIPKMRANDARVAL